MSKTQTTSINQAANTGQAATSAPGCKKVRQLAGAADFTDIFQLLVAMLQQHNQGGPASGAGDGFHPAVAGEPARYPVQWPGPGLSTDDSGTTPQGEQFTTQVHGLYARNPDAVPEGMPGMKGQGAATDQQPGVDRARGEAINHPQVAQTGRPETRPLAWMELPAARTMAGMENMISVDRLTGKEQSRPFWGPGTGEQATQPSTFNAPAADTKLNPVMTVNPHGPRDANHTSQQGAMAVNPHGLRDGDHTSQQGAEHRPAATTGTANEEHARGTNQTREVPVHMVADNFAGAVKNAGATRIPAMHGPEPPHHQLAEAIRLIARDGEGRTHVRLQLQPESLGEVVIRVVYKDGNLATHFHAATEGARQVIESSLSQLREALAGHQLNLQHSTVSAGGEEGRWGQDWTNGRRFDQPTRQNTPEPDATGLGNETAPAAPLAPKNVPGGLNYFV